VTHLNNQISNEANTQADALEGQSRILFEEVVKLMSVVNGNKKQIESSDQMNSGESKPPSEFDMVS